jgi:hypothetical protein
MDHAREQRIRERAYFIWRREGCPDGRHLVHWQLACEDIERAESLSDRQWRGLQVLLPRDPSKASG